MVVSGTTVYAGGYSTTSSGIMVPGYWANGVWHRLTPLNSKKDSMVQSLFVFGTTVYAGGYCVDGDGIKVPGYWVNRTWHRLASLDPSQDSLVNSVVVVAP